jgi:hypothetical protein
MGSNCPQAERRVRSAATATRTYRGAAGATGAGSADGLKDVVEDEGGAGVSGDVVDLDALKIIERYGIDID